MTGQVHMQPPWSNQDPVWEYWVSLFCLLDRYATVPIKSFGEDARKLRWHVLNDQDGRQGRNQQWKDLAKCLRSASRDANDKTEGAGN